MRHVMFRCPRIGHIVRAKPTSQDRANRRTTIIRLQCIPAKKYVVAALVTIIVGTRLPVQVLID